MPLSRPLNETYSRKIRTRHGDSTVRAYKHYTTRTSTTNELAEW